MIEVENHPLLELSVFITRFDQPLGEIPPSSELTALMEAGAVAPLNANDADRQAVRELLRFGGFKPTGRSKPASEYLIKARDEGKLASINLAVDACNAVSLHSGLPISVVDLSFAEPPLRIAIASQGTSYVFNPSGQSIDIGGLLCLFDASGPCASAVKDSQRTKTGPHTRRTLSIIWGARKIPDRCQQASGWYHSLLTRHGGRIEEVNCRIVRK